MPLRGPRPSFLKALLLSGQVDDLCSKAAMKVPNPGAARGRPGKHPLKKVMWGLVPSVHQLPSLLAEPPKKHLQLGNGARCSSTNRETTPIASDTTEPRAQKRPYARTEDEACGPRRCVNARSPSFAGRAP